MPVALAFALILALGAGSRSGWRTQADMAEEERLAQERRAREAGAPPPPPPPSVQGSSDEKWRYYFAYVVIGAAPPKLFYRRGPMWLSDWEAAREQMDLLATGQKHGQIVLVKRFDFIPGVGWRSASDEPSIGARPTRSGTVRGAWPFAGLPREVRLDGRVFERAKFSLPYPGVVAQYREAVARGSRHLFVLETGRFIVPHIDEANPDKGLMIEHAVRDLLPTLLPQGRTTIGRGGGGHGGRHGGGRGGRGHGHHHGGRRHGGGLGFYGGGWWDGPIFVEEDDDERPLILVDRIRGV